jgi:hypothetical protein
MKLIVNLLFVGQLCPLSATRRCLRAQKHYVRDLLNLNNQSQVYVNLNFVIFLAINPPFLVHKSLVHKILVHKIQVHKSLGHRKFGIFLWFTFFLSSQISSEPVNHGSQITPAPIRLNN